MREQEKLLRDTVDPKLYDTFRRIILKDEKEKIEEMRTHEKGCSEKCRIRHTALDLDLQRNKDLVAQLTSFDWCDRCVGGCPTSALSPPSGKGFPACTNACGQRLVAQCKPLMEQYGATSSRIKTLEERFRALDTRDVSLAEYKEKKEKFKTDARRAQLDVSDAAGVEKFLQEMNLGGNPTDRQNYL